MHLTADRRGLSSVVVDNNLTMATWRFEQWLKNAGHPQPSRSPDLARSVRCVAVQVVCHQDCVARATLSHFKPLLLSDGSVGREQQAQRRS